MSYLGFIIKLAPDPGPGPRGWLRDCSESLEDLLGNGSKTGPPAMAWDRSQAMALAEGLLRKPRGFTRKWLKNRSPSQGQGPGAG